MLKEALEHHFKASAYTFSNGREALLAVLKALKLQSGDEVIMPAYTCIVVPNAVIAAGGTPVYCDIEPRSLQMNKAELTKKITSRTKVIICQHTFGLEEDTAGIKQLCSNTNIHVIEDCAHNFDSTNSSIGTKGDSIVLSFGRDKAISGVAGGAIIVRNPSVAHAVEQQAVKAKKRSLWHIAKLIHYPLWYTAAKRLWNIGLGKPYLALLAKLQLFPKIVTTTERNGHMSPIAYVLPNACAILALQQWSQRRIINNHRTTLTKWYKTHISQLPQSIEVGSHSLQKFPLLIKNRDAVVATLKQKDIYLQDGWSGSTINPPSSAIHSVGYITGSCPNAEYVGAHIVSLPTHIHTSIQQAAVVVDAIQHLVAQDSNASIL